jgi:hypothetical protein
MVNSHLRGNDGIGDTRRTDKFYAFLCFHQHHRMHLNIGDWAIADWRFLNTD